MARPPALLRERLRSGRNPIERAAKYMGHADISTMYKHYLHLFADSNTDDMDRLAAVASRPALRPVAQIGG